MNENWAKPAQLLKPEGRGNKKKSEIYFFLVSIGIIKISFGQNSQAQIGYSLLTKIYSTCSTLKHYQLNADKKDK